MKLKTEVINEDGHLITIWDGWETTFFHELLDIDQIESLELQLTEIVQQLYAYRKEHEND